jgi:hypothetical protein
LSQIIYPHPIAFIQSKLIEHIEDDDYDELVEKWERELSDLQRMAGKESILEESLMKTSLKRICTGKIREYVDMNEAVLSFARLRNDVMDYALKKHRESTKTTTHTGMDLSSVVEEMKDRKSVV